MNKFDRLFKRIIGEANLVSTASIDAAIDKIAADKEITDERIINWLKKTEKRYFENINNDAENERKGLIKKYTAQEGDPSWMSNAYTVEYTPEREDFLKHVVDYFNAMEGRQTGWLDSLYKKTADQVYKKEVPDWDKSLSKNVGKVRKNVDNAARAGLTLDVDYEIIEQLSDGSKWVQALTTKMCSYEGETMGHCAAGYDPSKIISFWDVDNSPHVTLEVNDKRQIKQIKGKSNAAPVPKYVPYVVDFIKKYNYDVIEDGRNVGMVPWKGKFYFKDSNKFEQVYKNEIIPAQRDAIERIRQSIITINEKFQYVLGYVGLLK